jgi:hypothetical protein
VAKITNVSAPDAFSFATCAAGDGLLRSHGAVAITCAWCALVRPLFRPRR